MKRKFAILMGVILIFSTAFLVFFTQTGESGFSSYDEYRMIDYECDDPFYYECVSRSDFESDGVAEGFVASESASDASQFADADHSASASCTIVNTVSDGFGAGYSSAGLYQEVQLGLAELGDGPLWLDNCGYEPFIGVFLRKTSVSNTFDGSTDPLLSIGYCTAYGDISCEYTVVPEPLPDPLPEHQIPNPLPIVNPPPVLPAAPAAPTTISLSASTNFNGTPEVHIQ